MSGKRLDVADMDARAEALEECHAHLGLNWTDDAREAKAAIWLRQRLLREANYWRELASDARAIRAVRGAV